MRPSVFYQTLSELRRDLLHWTVGLAAAALILILLHLLLVRIVDLNQAANLRLMQFLFHDAQNLDQLPVWMQAAGFGLLFPAVEAVFSIKQGSWMVAGEEERGSLGLLLAAPIPRHRLVLEKFAVLALATLIPVLGLWFFLSLLRLFGVPVMGVGELFQSVINLFLLGLMFGTLGLALGCLTGNQLLSIRLSAGFLLLAFILNRLPADFPGKLILNFLSPFYYYAEALAGRLYSASYSLVMLIFIGAGFGLAWLAFEQRDLPV